MRQVPQTSDDSIFESNSGAIDIIHSSQIVCIVDSPSGPEVKVTAETFIHGI